MSHWQILGIEQTDDPAAIKRAYAAKVKETKPDEDPEGFGQLHRAYKQALAAAKRRAVNTARTEEIPRPAEARLDAQPSPEPNPPTDPVEEEPAVIAPPVDREAVSGQPLVAADEHSEDLNRDWERVTAQVCELLDDPRRANRVDSWRFLESEYALYDFQFKREFSRFLFGRVMEQYAIKKPAVRYLDSLFRWSDERDTLEVQYGYEEVELLLGGDTATESIQWTCPKQHRGPLEHGNYYARIFATVLDVVLMVFIYEGLLRFSIQPLGESGFVGGIALFLIAAPILEATPMQGTPAKVLFGLKVTSSRGTRLSPLHSVARMLVYAACTALLKITVWINLFTRDERLLHDRLSSSLVVKRGG
jgi:uncharacterized RDD family membrane protein YckC